MLASEAKEMVKPKTTKKNVRTTKAVSKVISRRRFFEKDSDLHCVSVRDVKADEKLPRNSRVNLYKIRLSLNLFPAKCLKGLTPPQHIAVHEAMSDFKEKVSILRYCPVQ